MKYLVLLLSLLTISIFGFSQKNNTTEDSKVSINGFVNSTVYGGSNSYDISSAYCEFGLETSYRSEKARFVSDLRFRQGIFFNEKQTQIEFKECFAEYFNDYFEFSLGNRIIKYGKATGLNPTDNLSPKNYFFLSSDIEDMQMSNFMITTKLKPAHWLNMELIVIPIFKPSIYRYELFDISESASFNNYISPDISFDNMSYSAHLSTSFSFADISLSGFHGLSNFYGFDVINIEPIPTMSITNSAAFYKKSSIGMDFSIPISTWILNAEGAYNHTTDYKENLYIPNPNIHYVIGIEKDISKLKFIAEYSGKYTVDFVKNNLPSFPTDFTDTLQLLNYMNETVRYESENFNRRIFDQYYKINHLAILTIHGDFFYDALSCDLSYINNFTTSEYLIRATAKWKITDNLATTIGGQVMGGPNNSIYNLSSDIFNGVYFSFKYSF